MSKVNREKYFDAAKFLKIPDINWGKNKEAVVTIQKFEEITTRLGLRPILRIRGYDAPLGLNATNLEALCDKFGEESRDWENKKITLYQVKTTNPSDGGKEVDGIRIK